VKLLPCDTCDTGHASLDPKGDVPYTLERFPRDGREFYVRCRRCKKPTALTVFGFNALPDLTPEDLETLGMLDHVAKDLTLGGAVTLDQAKDLVRAGLSLPDVHALDKSVVLVPPPAARKRPRATRRKK
jgi:hypothetical protein